MKYLKLYEDIDPFNEEDWDELDKEVYDYELERPGLKVWHIKGDKPNNIKWKISFDKFTEHIKKKNPKFINKINRNPRFWCGITLGMYLQNAKNEVK